ncbi:MAG: iron-containing alcohol dehydrogenase [Ezakiella coagulans]|uniref:iron-containing alcohol dehydrogenase n=1 Tax=Ezakiella coagulans TaxID=46507 RepID=UPI002014B069|nr:iron-containing alcohol dehydrogenase [Ezakiella coagulans]UQK60097.1 iron-containing alcohol dehydrogenase [Ezakiella coagulans]
MDGFIFRNPVKIIFKEGAVEHLKEEIKPYNRILLVYGGGSIKKTGIYDKVMKGLEGKSVTELSGIIPNPETTKVYEGIELCRKNDIDFILAVGGGSVIDSAKAIAAGAKLDGDFWDELFMKKNDITDAIPLGSVLTMVGTGSEMNSGGVITNPDVKIKCSYGNPLLYPVFSLLDPTFTYTVPKIQMVSGIVDMFSHIMEVYFSLPDDDNISDNLSESLMAAVIRNARIAIKDQEDYGARSNLMWIASLAINGLLALGKGEDWQSHTLEHTLSAYYHIPHGLGLAIVHPHYLKYVYKGHGDKFKRFLKRVFDVDPSEMNEDEAAELAISKIQDFFKELGAPTKLHEMDIDESRLEEMAMNTDEFKVDYSDLKHEDILKIYKSAL